MAVVLVGSLVAGIEALADRRVGIKPDWLAVLGLLHEFMRRQGLDRRHLRRRVGRADHEAGTRQQVFLRRNRLLASAQCEGRGQNQGGGKFLHHITLSEGSRREALDPLTYDSHPFDARSRPRLRFGYQAGPLPVKQVSVAIVGAGPAGLYAAEILSAAGLSVTLYDRMPSPARKFLMAGRGGLNLTHSEPITAFLDRYGAARSLMAAALARFSPDDLRIWAAGLGEETFTGSSGRVFPKSFKASPLLRAWLRRLEAQGVRLLTRHEWQGFGPDRALRFSTPSGEKTIHADAVLLALGGASWPRLGADGSWITILKDSGVAAAPFRPANAGWLIAWSDHVTRHAGQPLKRVMLSCGEAKVRGDIMLTRTGIEGGPVYALGPHVRAALEQNGTAPITIDVRPDLSHDALAKKLATMRKGASLAKRLAQMGVSPAMASVLREDRLLPTDADALAARIKAVPLNATGFAGLERAISSAGGITRDAIDDHLMLKALPGVFVAGEMLDWEAPTGGYLLQGCFATGAWAADGIIAFAKQAQLSR